MPEVLTLQCGAKLWVIPRTDLPVITASLALPAGAGVHGPSLAGLASMTAGMLDEGTATRSAVDLAREAESMATNLWANAGWDGSYVGLRCLTPNLDKSLELTVDILRNPSFPEPEWQRVRGQTIAALKARRDRPESLAARALQQSLYPADHPYSVPADGTVETLEQFDRSSLERFHQEYYRPVGSAWIIAGDIDPEGIADRLDAALETGRARPRQPIELPNPGPSPARRILLIHRPDASQAVIRVGHIGMKRREEDYLEAMLLNQILGGQFTSRLNESLRERKGLTYGVRSSFDTRRGTGPFSVASSVQSDRVAEAVAEVALEIEAIRGDRPPTHKELEDARRSLLEGQARHFETPSDLISRFAALILHDLPPDHHARFAERMNAVDLDRLVSVAGRRLRPESLIAVVVADAEQVQQSLEQLGWGAVERVEIGRD